MKGKRIVKVEDISNILSGYAFNSKLFNDSEGMPVIRIRDILNGYTETYYNGEYEDKYIIHLGDILIGMDGEFNISKWKSEDALLNQRVCKIEFDSKQVNEIFMIHLLKKELKKIEEKTPFVTVKHLSVNKIKDIVIELPSIEEQNRIASILEKGENTIGKRKEADRLAEEYLKALFVEMFGDLKQNKNGWESSDIEHIALKVTDGEHKTPIRDDRGIKLFSARNIQNGYITFDTGVDYISEDEYLRIKKRCNPEYGDILMSCSGTIGRVCTVRIKEPFSLVRSVALIKPNPELIRSLYLEHYLRSDYLQILINKNANKSSQANIFTGQIKSLPVLLPPLDLQNKFASIVEKVESFKQKQKQSSNELDTLFKSLIQRAFNGEL